MLWPYGLSCRDAPRLAGTSWRGLAIKEPIVSKQNPRRRLQNAYRVQRAIRLALGAAKNIRVDHGMMLYVEQHLSSAQAVMRQVVEKVEAENGK